MKLEGRYFGPQASAQIRRYRLARLAGRRRARFFILLVLVLIIFGSTCGATFIGAVGALAATGLSLTHALGALVVGLGGGLQVGFITTVSLGIVWAVVGGIYLLVTQDNHARIQERCTFAEGLLHLLQEDLAPRKRLWVTFDGTGGRGELTWRGKSPHGNLKQKFHNRWLVVRGTLFEGTRLSVERHCAVKMKKGGVMKHKRRADVVLTTRFPLDPPSGTLQQIATDAVAGVFKNPPEGLRVELDRTAEVGAGTALRIKILQLDAQITPDEIVTLLTQLLPSLVRPPSRS